MLVAPQTSRTTVREYLLFAAAILLGLLLATRLSGGDLSKPPGRIPEQIAAGAVPLPPSAATSSHELLRQIVQSHATGDHRAALARWSWVRLRCQDEAWRSIGAGVAHLQLGDSSRALQALEEACAHDPLNAAAHYFRAIATLASTESGADGSRPTEAEAAARSLRERDAIAALHRCLKVAPLLDRDRPLLPRYRVQPAPFPLAAPLDAPSTGDLLEALWPMELVGSAHATLAQIYLENGDLKLARFHLEQAMDAGWPVWLGVLEAD